MFQNMKRLFCEFRAMGNWGSSLNLSDEYTEEIAQETGFTTHQVKGLWGRFLNLDKERKGHLTKEDFLKIPELQNNPLGERIVQAFFKDGLQRRLLLQESKQNTEDYESECGNDVVNFDDFVRVFAHFRPPKKNPENNQMNTREDKLRFAFNMYDMDNDGLISKFELLAILTLMIGDNISSEHLESIAERIVVEADLDGDDHLNFEEFCQALERIDVEKKMSIRFLS